MRHNHSPENQQIVVVVCVRKKKKHFSPSHILFSISYQSRGGVLFGQRKGATTYAVRRAPQDPKQAKVYVDHHHHRGMMAFGECLVVFCVVCVLCGSRRIWEWHTVFDTLSWCAYQREAIKGGMGGGGEGGDRRCMMDSARKIWIANKTACPWRHNV